MMAFRKPLIAALLALVVAGPAFAQAPAPTAGATPLLMAGKKTLFQRVLTRPGAQFSAKAGDAGAGAEIPPLSIFYVYARAKAGANNADWVQLGTNSQGKLSGWVPADQVIDWKQTLTLAFANPAERERVLFFKDRKPLIDLLEAKDLEQRDNQIHLQIRDNKLPADSPVISIEPETYVDIAKQFYLLPILEADRAVLQSGFQLRVAKVASVTLEKGKDDVIANTKSRGNSADPSNDPKLKDFKAAVVFVIDATSSMGPYIDRTREAVKRIYEKIEAAGLNDKVRFGLVAYRDDPKAVNGIEYLSKIFVDPNKARTSAEFMTQVRDLKPASISTRAFAEDGFAGVETAVDGIKWDEFGARYLVMVSDAASRQGKDKFASTGLNTAEMRQRILDRGLAMYMLHLLTPEGKADHPAAKKQYEQLTDYPGVGPLYYPVDSGSVNEFGTQVDRLAEAITGQVQSAAKGQDAKKAAAAAPAAGSDKSAQRLQQQTAALGMAMQLAYLGRVEGTKAPRLFEAWAADRDFKSPDTASLDVRLLMTKNQLNDLQQALKAIVQAGKAAQLSPNDFFNQLQSAAAAMSRDPSRVGRQGTKNLADTGLLGEYLDDLPYQSKIMGIDQALWSSWSIGEQQAFIDEIDSKIRLYQRYYEDTGKWVALDGGASAGDAVFPVPLDALP